MAATALVWCLTGALPAFAVIPGREAPVPVRDTYNPRPDANDILLPMPCDLEMALRKVVVPGGAAFYIGKYEVSGYQWNAVMTGECGALSAGAGALPLRERPPSEVREFLTRYNAWLAKAFRDASGLFAGGADGAVQARLPGAEEWEFAARGGLAVSDEERGRDIPQDKLREYGVISDPTPIQSPERIGSLKPNPLGLYDTVGNVKEMVAASSDAAIAFKGGSFRHTPGEVRLDGQDEITSRNERGEERRVSDLGFRVAFSGAGYEGVAARRALRPEKVGPVAADWLLVAASATAAFLLGGIVVWLLLRRRDDEDVEAKLREEAAEWKQQFKELKTVLLQARKEAAAREEARLAAEKQADEYRALLDRARQESEAREQARRAAEARAAAAEKRAAEVEARSAPSDHVADDQLRNAQAELEQPRKQAEEQVKAAEIRAPHQPASPDTFVNSLGIEFVLVPAGSFLMGSPEGVGEDDEHPQHRVTITRPFYLGKFPVTQAQWLAVMGNNPSIFQGWFKSNGRNPVETVSWDDTQKFIRELNAREGHNRYRLPTEAEWEYAARAGSETAYCFGNDKALLGNYAWYKANSGGKPHPVGSKEPNAWGLYDMHGNVWEWVQDWYGVNYNGAAVDPQGPRVGNIRSLRGGGWNHDADLCRSAFRGGILPGFCDASNGFRLALSLE